MGQVETAIQDKYSEKFSWCYGCGKHNESGLHVRTGWDGDKTVSYHKPREENMAIPGFVYGGLIASVMDCHGTGSAALALHRKNGHEPEDDVEPPRFVTASLHVDYMKPTPQGVELKLIGTPEEIHPKRWKTTIEMFAGEECCGKGEIIAVVAPDTFFA